MMNGKDSVKKVDNTPDSQQAFIISGNGPQLTIPDLTVGLGTKFYESLEKFKDKVHHIDAYTGASESKESVRSRGVRVAMQLRKCGIGLNNVVIISSKMHIDVTVSVLGILFIGAIVAPLHPDHSYEDMKTFVSVLQPKFAFCSIRSSRLIARIIKEQRLNCPVYTYQTEQRNLPSFDKCFEIREDPNFVVANISEPKTATAFISYTEGTETEQKIVSLSHQAMVRRYQPIMELWVKKSEKCLCTFPLTYFVQIVVMCMCLDSQAKHVLLGPITERTVCKAIHEKRVENLFIDANLGVSICKNVPVSDFDLTCLKHIFLTKAVSTGNYIRIVKTFRKSIIITDYSTVEIGTITLASQDTFLKHKDKINSVGPLIGGVYAKLGPPISGVAIQGWGELYIKAPGMVTGYFNNSAVLKMNRGYIRTGDLARIDAENFLYIKGRASDEISREDHVFSTTEVDNAITAHPDVMESATYLNEFGDLVSCVIRKPGREISQDTIFKVVAGILPQYKVPTKIMFKDNLPKTLLGTVKKYKLNEGQNRVLIRDESFYHAYTEEQ